MQQTRSSGPRAGELTHVDATGFLSHDVSQHQVINNSLVIPLSRHCQESGQGDIRGVSQHLMQNHHLPHFLKPVFLFSLRELREFSIADAIVLYEVSVM